MPSRDFQLIAATHTPLSADGRLNPEIVPPLADYLVSVGVTGVFIAGTTGEGHSLTVAEREELATAWSAAVAELPLKLFVNAGHNSYQDACRLAAHAESVGADSVAVQCPSFHKPEDIAALIDYCKPIASAAARTPFYLYDIPGLSGVSLPTAQFLSEAVEQIPTLRGVKYSNPYLVGLQECVQLQDGRFEVFYGSDENMLAGLTYGVAGAIGSTYNFAAPLYHEIRAAFEAGDLATARRKQFESVQIAQTLIACGVIAASKYAVTLIGIDCGPVRPPLKNLTAEAKSTVQSVLAAHGLLEQSLAR